MNDTLFTNPDLLAMAKETAMYIDDRPAQGAVCRVFLHDSIQNADTDLVDAIYMEALTRIEVYGKLFDYALLHGPAALIDAMAENDVLVDDLGLCQQMLTRLNHLNQLLTGRKPVEMSGEAALSKQLHLQLAAALSDCCLGNVLVKELNEQRRKSANVQLEHFRWLLEAQDMNLHNDHTSVMLCLHMVLLSAMRLGVNDEVPAAWIIPCTCMAYNCMQAVWLSAKEHAYKEGSRYIQMAGAVCALLLAGEDDVPDDQRLPLIRRLFDAAVASMEQIGSKLRCDYDVGDAMDKLCTRHLEPHICEARSLYPVSCKALLHMNSDEQ